MALPEYRDYADHLLDGSDCDLPLPYLPPDPPPSPAEALAELRLEAALRDLDTEARHCDLLETLHQVRPLPEALLDRWQRRYGAKAARVRAAAAAWARARGDRA